MSKRAVFRRRSRKYGRVKLGMNELGGGGTRSVVIPAIANWYKRILFWTCYESVAQSSILLQVAVKNFKSYPRRPTDS